MRKRTSNLGNIRGVLYTQDPFAQKQRTTMTGLPWEVRHNPDGAVKPQDKSARPKPRMGNYVYTYGLPENRRAKPQTPAKPKLHEPEVAESIHRYLKANNALGKAHYTPSLTELMKETGNTLSPSESTKDLTEVEDLWDDTQDDYTESSNAKNSYSVTSAELAEAAEAFNWPGKSAQEVEKPAKFSLTHPRKPSRDQKTIREILPPPRRLHPNHEKVINEQVKQEFMSKKTVPSQTDYIKRKQQLTKAVIRSGHNQESPTPKPVFPDVVSEYNYRDLFSTQPSAFDILKRPTYVNSQYDPRRHIQVLSPPMVEPQNLTFTQRKESLIGKALRDADSSGDELSEQSLEVPVRKRTKDEERKRQLAIRALENYRLVQDRQKEIVHRLPQITVQSPSQIPSGSQHHQVVLGHFHQTFHPRPSNRIPTFKISDISRRYKSNAVTRKSSPSALLTRQDQKYPIHGDLDIPPPPPPITTTIFPKQRKYSGNRR